MKLIADTLLWLSAQWWSPVAELVFWTWYFGLLFAAYAAFHRARLVGTLRPAHWFVLAPVLVQGYPLDLAWNIVVGSAIYREKPWNGGGWPWTWTFTSRCIRLKSDGGWRGSRARWWASMLNALDPGHV